MKLRLHGNTLRLRLTRGEVDRFHETGRVEEAIRFPGGAGLVWILESSSLAEAPGASYGDSAIRVVIPAAQARAWATSNDVGIYSTGSPAITVEKDFECLHDDASGPREDDADAFPNPAAIQKAG